MPYHWHRKPELSSLVLQQGFHQPTAESRCLTCANHKSRSRPGTSPVLPPRTVLGATAWSQCFAPMSHVHVLTHTCTHTCTHTLPSAPSSLHGVSTTPARPCFSLCSLLSRSHSLTVSLIFFSFFFPFHRIPTPFHTFLLLVLARP